MKTAVCVFLTVLAMVHASTWTEQQCGAACPMNFDPYCVTFQKTVPNKCAGDIEICKMRAKGYTVTSSSNGTCTCSSVCTADYNPVCAVDLNTEETQMYPNQCTLNLAVCQGKRLGKVSMDKCPVPLE